MTGRKSYTQFAGNLASIIAFQAGNYLLAFLNFPYLTRTLGVVDYGVLAYTVSVNACLWLMMDWGFSLGSAREVAQALGDKDAIRDVFWRTMTAKILLAGVAVIALVAAAFSGASHRLPLVIVPGLLNILGSILNVDWLMQGIEKMGAFALYSLAGRGVCVLLVFICVHSPADTWLACDILGLSAVLAGVAGLLAAVQRIGLGAPRFPFRRALWQIRDYRHYFLAQSGSIAYVAGAPMMLTWFGTLGMVGLFAAADRIARIMIAVVTPVTIALYPRINALLAQSRESAAQVAGLFLLSQFIFGAALTIVLAVWAAPISHLVLGGRFDGAVAPLRWLAPLPLATILATTLSRQFLVPLGWRVVSSRLTLFCAAFFLVILAIITHRAGAVGAAAALVSAEAMLAAGSLAWLLHREPEYMKTAFAAALDSPSYVRAALASLRREGRGAR